MADDSDKGRGRTEPSRPGELRRRSPMSLADLLWQSSLLSAQTANIGLGDWRRAVGVRLAQKTLPERLDDGVLTVRVPSSTWAQELSLLSHVVLERLQAAGHGVQRMRFRVHASATLPERPTSAPARAELPESLQRSLDGVDDPALRRAIAEAASYSLGRKP